MRRDQRIRNVNEKQESFEQLVSIPAGDIALEGVLALLSKTDAVVLFAHGSGSSRHSSRNKFVAGVIQKAGIGTLLFDLLSAEEDAVYENRFDIVLLAERLKAATRWLRDYELARNCRFGYFGSSTGAAAALIAAADQKMNAGAVVSRGGRTDLAGSALKSIQVPTLFLVGGQDEVILDINRESYRSLSAEKALKIIPGATHLFEEAGALEEVAELAAEWFRRHLLA